MSNNVGDKLWHLCHTLRHDGIGYMDYIEQITYLLFLKMAEEKAIDLRRLKYKAGTRETTVDCSWPALRDTSGTDLTDHYIEVLRCLGRQPGILGDIYSGAQSRFTKPVNLKMVINLIDEVEWTSLGIDVKAEAYEHLLEKAASEGKKGAGQYFTPRKLMQAVCACIRPDPRVSKDFTICDPACGTGGFLVCAYEWLMDQTKGGTLEREVAKRVKAKTYLGQDLTPTPRRLALMNLFLHNVEPRIGSGDTIYDPPPSDRYDIILTNPPFGTKGAGQAPSRDDFVVETSNKQLNFVQHILTVLKPGGRAAVVLPDNCLFADQAGEVFKVLTESCNLHTVLRLPRGTFTPYCQGVKANVVFFQKGYASKDVWIYDARANVPGVTKKDRPLTRDHFAEFVRCYGVDANGRFGPRQGKPRSPDDSPTGDKGWLGGGRWRKFGIDEVKERDFKLDGFKWLKDDSVEDADDLPEPEELATDAISELEGAVEELGQVLALLEGPNGR
jgi:type I restriction enzyme M protein